MFVLAPKQGERLILERGGKVETGRFFFRTECSRPERHAR